jgi:hypothetical protein
VELERRWICTRRSECEEPPCEFYDLPEDKADPFSNGDPLGLIVALGAAFVNENERRAIGRLYGVALAEWSHVRAYMRRAAWNALERLTNEWAEKGGR